MSKKKRNILGVVFVLSIAIVYFGLTAMNVLLFWTPDENWARVLQLMAMIGSGLIVWSVCYIIFRKRYNVLIHWFLIASVAVASTFKTVVRLFDGDFSIAYILLGVSVFYYLFKEEN
jgi:hypothetical protein